MKSTRRILLAFAFLSLGLAAPAHAEAPKPEGAFGAWKVYSFPDGKGKTCFAATEPKKQEGNFKKRGTVLVFITRWPEAGGKTSVSVSIGYPFKKGSTASLRIDDTDFDLFTHDETAWTKDGGDDAALVQALQKGKTLVVRGTSARGTATADTYSLEGSAAAVKALAAACPSSSAPAKKGD